jgi:hypothetical protein
LQKIFRKSKLSDGDVVKHMHVVLNIVRFLYKKRHFRTHLPNPYEQEVVKVEGQEKLDLQLFEEAEKMYDEITPKTRKKRFKMLKVWFFGVVSICLIVAVCLSCCCVGAGQGRFWCGAFGAVAGRQGSGGRQGDAARHHARRARQPARGLLAHQARPQERGQAETLLPLSLRNVDCSRVYGESRKKERAKKNPVSHPVVVVQEVWGKSKAQKNCCLLREITTGWNFD